MVLSGPTLKAPAPSLEYISYLNDRLGVRTPTISDRLPPTRWFTLGEGNPLLKAIEAFTDEATFAKPSMAFKSVMPSPRVHHLVGEPSESFRVRRSRRSFEATPAAQAAQLSLPLAPQPVARAAETVQVATAERVRLEAACRAAKRSIAQALEAELAARSRAETAETLAMESAARVVREEAECHLRQQGAAACLARNLVFGTVRMLAALLGQVPREVLTHLQPCLSTVGRECEAMAREALQDIDSKDVAAWLDAGVTDGGWKLGLDWSSIISAAKLDVAGDQGGRRELCNCLREWGTDGDRSNAHVGWRGLMRAAGERLYSEL